MKSKKIKRFAVHVAFWLTGIAMLTFFYGHFTGQYPITFGFVLLLMPVIMGTVYFINYNLVPKFLLSGKLWRFALYFIYALIASVYLQLMMVIFAYINLADYQYDRLNPISSDVVFLVFGTYFVVFLATSVKILKYWYQSQAQLIDVEKARLEAQLKLRETELKVLQGQIQPHFLFNTLNNLYGLALEKSSQLPTSILQLSDMLDFLLYRADKKLISLKTELKFVHDYLELERLRFGEKLLVEEMLTIDNKEIAIPPFTLFTFVENAFKHGFSQQRGNIRLLIQIKIEHQQLQLEVINSLTEQEENEFKSGGIGLLNLRQRLNHLYADFDLKTSKTRNEFRSYLQIDLQSRKDTDGV